MALFEDLDFVENPLFEGIISDLGDKGYSLVPDFFSLEERAILRQALVDRFEADRFKKAAIGNKTNELIKSKVRGDFILWLDEATQAPAEQLFFEKTNALATYLNRTCFMGILQKEFHFALYPEGTGYQRHLDTFQNDDRRKLSMVCYLNEEDWQPNDGGELVLYLQENGQEKPVSYTPYAGQMVIFESQVLEHEVLAAQRPRLSITGWLKTR